MNKTKLFEKWYGEGIDYNSRELMFEKNAQGEYKLMQCRNAFIAFSAGIDAGHDEICKALAGKN